MNALKAPVALFVFNRPKQTRAVFTAIAAARPSRLLLIADGPRTNVEIEAQRCQEVRKIVSTVDWPCEVKSNFSDVNLGCRRRMISGLNWVFSQAEEAIILEDDCLPDPSFFPYCAELLDRYRKTDKIGIISGHNPLQDIFPFRYSYCFSKMGLIWGWATWRRNWEKYDEHMTTWPAIKDDILKSVWAHSRDRSYWAAVLENMYRGEGPSAWDYQLMFKSWAQHWLNIVPRRNLVQNIGFGVDATHTRKSNPISEIPAQSLSFPLTHPATIVEWSEHPQLLQDKIYNPDLLTRTKRAARLRLKRVISLRLR